MRQNCRLCLNGPVQGYSLLNSEIGNMLESLTTIKVLSDDIYSTITCFKCMLNVKLAYDIQQNILKVNEQLRNELVNNIEIKEEIPNHIKDEDKEEDEIEFCKVENYVDEDLIANKEYNQLTNENEIEFCKVENYVDEYLIANKEYNQLTNENRDLDIKAEMSVEECIIEDDDYKDNICDISTNDDTKQEPSTSKEIGNDLYLFNKATLPETVTIPKLINCKKCEKNFESNQQFDGHLKNTIQCPICHKTHTECNFGPHLRDHYSITRPVCELCKESFPNRLTLRSHMKQKHKLAEEKQKCRDCKKVFRKGLAFDTNPEANEGKKQHVCISCVDKSSKYSTKIQMHRVLKKICHTPPKVKAAANIASESLEIYENTYQKFMNWRNENKVNSFSENVILSYLAELAKKFKSSTLWSNFSMLKTTINIKHNVDIGKYNKVLAYLKKKNEGYTPKKSLTLKKEHVLKFMHDAPDETFLLTKIILLFGVAGGLRRDELYKLQTDDIQDLGSVLVVIIRDTKTKITRKFSITEYLEVYRKYASLRPKNYPEKKLFINYYAGRCTRQVVGINKIGRAPKEIAKFLKLPNCDLYTGHSFRRSSASIQVESGVDLLTLKQHGGWKSSAVAEGSLLPL